MIIQSFAAELYHHDVVGTATVGSTGKQGSGAIISCELWIFHIELSY